ncbi:hypothetical protein DWY17_09650 [Butyricicoccus sp. AF24-19AC]|nr:hypothetical protein DWY17_09650 [Butyricicoccus sp. AF24-19AC]
MCAYSVFNTFPVYPLSAKPLILLAFCRYRYHTSLFDRPGFLAMMEEVEAGRVEAIVIKDYCAIIGLNQKDLENQGILA